MGHPHVARGGQQDVSVVEVLQRRAQRDWEVYRPYYLTKLVVMSVFK